MKRLLPVIVLLASCSHQTEYERQDSMAVRQDTILTLITDCEAIGGQMIYAGPTLNKVRQANAERKGMVYISRHAHPSDYLCGVER